MVTLSDVIVSDHLKTSAGVGARHFGVRRSAECPGAAAPWVVGQREGELLPQP